jgi:hypothetical protein
MSQRLLTVRVRPARIAVLINNTSPPSDFVMVVGLLSQLWGGRFNPILPVSVDHPDPLTEFRLATFRPEFVFTMNLDDSIWEKATHKACQPRGYVRLEHTIAENFKKAGRLNLIRSDGAVIANVERRLKPAAVIRPVKTVSVDPASHWHAYYAALFGLHPETLNDKYRDEHAVVHPTSAVDLITLHQDIVEGWKESWLDAGSFGLSIDNMLFHTAEPTIVVVSDIIPDLCLFWNLRLASEPDVPAWIIPIPESATLNDDTLVALKDWLLAFRQYGRKPNYCVITSASVGKETIAEIAVKLQATLAGSGIDHVDYQPPKNRLPQIVAYEQALTWPAELRGQRLTIVPPAPETFSVTTSQSWFLDILQDNGTGRALRDMQLPESTVVPEILNSPCPPTHRRSIVPYFGDGVDSITFCCSSAKEVIHFQIPTAGEVLEEILREHGYEIHHDEKRSSYLPVIKLFGGLHRAATAMSGHSGQVLEILRSGRPHTSGRTKEADDIAHQSVLIAQGHALTPGDIKGRGKFGKEKLGDKHYLDRIDEMLRSESDLVKRIGLKRFQRFARRRIPDEMTVQSLLEHWAEKAVLTRKWVVSACPRCDRASYVDAINLRKAPVCIHCGTHVPMKESMGVAYALAPSVRHALSEGLATVALTGRFLRDMTTRGFFWLPGVKYERAGVRGDIDVFACCDGCLVFGECKKLTNTPSDAESWRRATEQFLRLASVALECGGRLVTLSALVDAFPDEVQCEIESALAGEISFLLLTKADLEKGCRAGNPENEGSLLHLRDLLPNPFPEPTAEQAPGNRTIDLGWSVFTKDAQDQPDQ